MDQLFYQAESREIVSKTPFKSSKLTQKKKKGPKIHYGVKILSSWAFVKYLRNGRELEFVCKNLRICYWQTTKCVILN